VTKILLYGNENIFFTLNIDVNLIIIFYLIYYFFKQNYNYIIKIYIIKNFYLSNIIRFINELLLNFITRK